ncbi:hypothetical protein CMI38_02215 [Candidatus Pacearchaeota archaeon]|jgi:hypothetical protein|nr:hypothetical protein [Candidatus Pacearchaeota archaeon]|tara:strand:+ start:2861 stop:3775 length:915 start_codon:yes stop_codon:yes gene_type:complete
MADTIVEVELEEILENNSRVYVDPSTNLVPEDFTPDMDDIDSYQEYNGNIVSHILDSSRYEDLNEVWIEYEMDRQDRINELLEDERSLTIPNATLEFGRFHGVLEKGDRLLKGNGSRGKKGGLLRDLVNSVKESVLLSEMSEVDVNSARVNGIYDMVILLSRAMDLKRKNESYKHYGRVSNRPNNPSKLNTDEEYVAVCLRDMIDGLQPSLITGDTDFVSLIGEVPRILGSRLFKPYNEKFSETFKECYPQLFLTYSSKIGLVDLFNCDSFNRRAHQSLKRKVIGQLRNMWESNYQEIYWGKDK